MPSPAGDISNAAATAQDVCGRPQPGSFHDIWPQAVISFGLGLTAAWIILLSYRVVELVKLAI